MTHIRCEMKDVYLERDNLDQDKKFKLFVEKCVIPKDNNTNKVPLMGKSGSGKSTLLNLMAAIEWPHSGSISWTFPGETEIKSWSKNGLSAKEAKMLRREYFGYAFQNSTLIPHLRVCDNLCYPLLFKGDSEKKARKAALEKLEHVLLEDEKENIEDLFKRFPSKLSGGQQQRIALVQAMIHNPCVIFTDEPTGSLDRDTRKQVMKVLYEWTDDPEYRGERLLVWVTHHHRDPIDAGVESCIWIDGGIPDWIEKNSSGWESRIEI